MKPRVAVRGLHACLRMLPRVMADSRRRALRARKNGDVPAAAPVAAGQRPHVSDRARDHLCQVFPPRKRRGRGGCAAAALPRIGPLTSLNC